MEALFDNRPFPAEKMAEFYELFIGENATLEVTVELEGDGEFTLLFDDRRFLIHNEILNGKKTHRFTASLCDYHRHDEEYTKKDSLKFAIMGRARITKITAEPTVAPTIYVIGDSTVCDQAAGYPYNPFSSYCGWGQMLPKYLGDGIALSNHAQGGLSTVTYFATNHSVVEKRIKKGDYLFMQFGHNDQKLPELDPFGGYKKNIEKLVDFARSKGATPVLCSSTNRIIFEPDGTLKNLLGEYRQAVMDVAKEKNTAFIDLWKKTTDYYVEAGPVGAWHYFHTDGKNRDYTHTCDIGGSIIAAFVAEELLKIPELAGYVLKEKLVIPPPVKESNTSDSMWSNPLDKVGFTHIPKGTTLK